MFSVELYGRVRHACHVEGLSIREAARRFGLHRNTVRKMLALAVPPGYRRRGPPARPRLGPFTAVIDRILEEDRSAPTKQRHTAKRIHEGTVNLAESATEFCNYLARSRDNFEISSRFAREHTTNNFKGKVSHASS